MFKIKVRRRVYACLRTNPLRATSERNNAKEKPTERMGSQCRPRDLRSFSQNLVCDNSSCRSTRPAALDTGLMHIFAACSHRDAQTLRARGVIIEDGEGRPHFLLTISFPSMKERMRQDPRSTSILFLDEAGHDNSPCEKSWDRRFGGKGPVGFSSEQLHLTFKYTLRNP